MNIPRLEHLITILEGVQKNNLAFSLRSWINKTKGSFCTTPSFGEDVATCGTVCCAMGYAALDPVFQAQGLALFDEQEYRCGKTVLIKTAADFNRLEAVLTVQPRYEDFEGFMAAGRFFDLDSDDTDYLFEGEDYPNNAYNTQPQHVVARIRKLIQAKAARQ